MELTAIIPKTERPEDGERLRGILRGVFAREEPERVIRTAGELSAALDRGELLGNRLFFAAALGEDGINLELCAMLREFRRRDIRHAAEKLRPSGCLAGCTGAVLIDALSEYDTKSTGREVVYTANEAGCCFPGRPLEEGTASLANYALRAKNLGVSLQEAYQRAAEELLARLSRMPAGISGKGRELLCVHACDEASSNTYWLWNRVKEGLPPGLPVREISLRGEALRDCAGCSYETCMSFSRNGGCLGGGRIVDEVYPALERCGALMVLAPNYNDALGAKLTAFINRLTSPYRRKPFDDRLLFALVVSGYSGSDLIVRQLIDALNMNKAFRLPGNFALTQTADMTRGIAETPEIGQRAAAFAEYIGRCFLTC